MNVSPDAWVQAAATIVAVGLGGGAIAYEHRLGRRRDRAAAYSSDLRARLLAMGDTLYQMCDMGVMSASSVETRSALRAAFWRDWFALELLHCPSDVLAAITETYEASKDARRQPLPQWMLAMGKYMSFVSAVKASEVFNQPKHGGNTVETLVRGMESSHERLRGMDPSKAAIIDELRSAMEELADENSDSTSDEDSASEEDQPAGAEPPDPARITP
jgi:hypothetical protein